MILNILDKLVNIVYRPIELISDWASEPLKNAALEREIDAAKRKGIAQAEIDKMILTYQHELRIKQEAEIARIYMDLDQLKKDKELSRQKEVSDAIMEYQKQLTRMNIDAVNAIGNMQLDLRAKAQALMQEKTQEYRALQTEAHQQARQELKELNEDYPDFERYALEREMLMDSIKLRLTAVITAAQHFLNALNDDIRVINTSITVLTERGQDEILKQIERFQVNANGILPSASATSGKSDSDDNQLATMNSLDRSKRLEYQSIN